MPLDPQARDFLDRLAAANLPPIQEQTIAQARAQMDFSTQFPGPAPAGGAGGGSFRSPDRAGAPRPDHHAREAGAGRHGRSLCTSTAAGGCSATSSRTRGLPGLANAAGVDCGRPSIIAWRPSTGSPRRPKTLTPQRSGSPLMPGSSVATRIGSRWRGDSAGGNLAAVACLMARDRRGPSLACPGADLSDHRLQPAQRLVPPVRRGLLPDPSRDGLVLGAVRREARRSLAPARLSMPGQRPERTASRAGDHGRV